MAAHMADHPPIKKDLDSCKTKAIPKIFRMKDNQTRCQFFDALG